MATYDRATDRPLGTTPVVPKTRAGMLDRRQAAVKRGFDLTAASIGLFVLLPLTLLVALIVRATSSGPAVYRHYRVGRHAVMFDVLKFRTMFESKSDPDWQITVAGDPRVTPIGGKLRKSHFDEIPQLWNVIRGEMSLVGWRPHVAGYPDELTGPDARLLGERPGITGAASLYFRDEERLLAQYEDPRQAYDETLYPLKVRMDMDYYERWSLWRDISILLVSVLPTADRWLKVVPDPMAVAPAELVAGLPAEDTGLVDIEADDHQDRTDVAA